MGGGGEVRRGTGGGFSACCLARRDSWESEALRNLRTEKRRCLLVSSWIGGDSGRLMDESRVGWRATVSPSLSLMRSGSGRAGGASMVGELGAKRVWRRISVSLAIMPRRRRKGIAATDHGTQPARAVEVDGEGGVRRGKAWDVDVDVGCGRMWTYVDGRNVDVDVDGDVGVAGQRLTTYRVNGMIPARRRPLRQRAGGRC